MQRPTVINNLLRTTTLARRLNRRQAESPGVIDVQTLSARRATVAMPALQHALAMAGVGSRFGVARVIPRYEEAEAGAGSAARQSFERRSTPPPPAQHGVTASAAHAFAHDEAPSVADSSHASVPRREGVNSAVKFPSGAPSPDSGAPAQRFKISRRSVPTTGIARAKGGVNALRAEAHNVVPEKSDGVKAGHPAPGLREASNDSSGASGRHLPVALTTARRVQAHRDVRDGGARSSVAPAASHTSRAEGDASVAIVARKYQPKRTAFSPKHTLLQRKSLSRGLASSAASSGARLRRTANVTTEAQRTLTARLHKSETGAPLNGSSMTAGRTVAMSPLWNGSEQPVPVARRAEGNSIITGQHRQSPAILRKAVTHTPAPVRRVESNNRADDSSSGRVLMRKATSALPAQVEIDRTQHAGSLVMRRAATQHGAPETQAAQSETAGGRLRGEQPSAPTAATMLPPEIDIAQLAEQVSRIISRRLAVERERRGLWK